MELQALKAAHRHCSHHREEIGRSTSVGCFYCLGGYPAAAIVEWTDDGDTAICPTCGIDRNEGGCDCTTDEIDPRWAALADLRLED